MLHNLLISYTIISFLWFYYSTKTHENQEFDKEHNLHYEKFADGTVKCIEDEIPFEIPDTWAWTRLDDICCLEIKRGKAPKYVEKSNIVVFAQKCNTKSGKIDLSLAQFLDERLQKKYSSTDYMQYGDIIINSTGTGTLGRVGIFEESNDCFHLMIVPDTHITTIRLFDSLTSRFVYYYLKFNQSIIESKGEGSTNQIELRPDFLRNILVPVPPIAEQKRIASVVILAFNKVSIIETNKKDVISLIVSAKSRILNLAIRGKLVPQNPDDEPASVLLERIKAEKEELIKQGKIKRDKKESTIFKGVDNSYYDDIPENWVLTALYNICWLGMSNQMDIISLVLPLGFAFSAIVGSTDKSGSQRKKFLL